MNTFSMSIQSNFLASDLGRCILGMAKQEIALALEELETADPTDAKRITEIINEIDARE